MGHTDRRKRRYGQLWIAIGATAAALCLTIFVLQRPKSIAPDDYEPAGTYRPTPADAAVRDKLKASIPSMDLSGVELWQAIGELREISGAGIRVNWAALAKERVMPETTVNVRLKNVTLDKAIRTVLDDVSCIGPGHQDETGMGHVVEDGAITITSKSDLDGHLDTREYDIRDITSLVVKFRRKEEMAVDEDGDPLFEVSRDEIVGEINCLVFEAINEPEPDVREKGEKLVVTLDTASHKSIAKVLEKLRTRLNSRSSDPCPEKSAAADVAVGELLDRKIGEFDFYDTELQKAINFIRDKSGVNIHVKWHAIARESIGPDAKVSVHSTNKTHDDGVRLENATFAEALQAVCRGAANEGEPGIGLVVLDYVVRDGAVMVSTEDALISPNVFRVYDVRDLIAPVSAREGPPVGRVEAVGRIRTLISDAIDRDSWRYFGEIGVICSIGGRLVITQTIDNHEAIDELLGDLRRHFKTPNLDPHSHHETQAERAIRKQLELKIPKLDLDDDEFGEAVSAVLGIYEPNMYANWRWPTGDEVKPPGKVSLHLKNVTRREALDAVFDIANKGSGLRMDYTIIGDRIMIAPQAKLLRSSTIRIYDARDIIARKMKATTAPARSRDKTVEEITGLIREAIAPGSWRDDGGSLGTIDEISGLLVITQICRHHESLAALMKKLRADTK